MTYEEMPEAQKKALLAAAATLLAEDEIVGFWAEGENEHSLQTRLKDLAEWLS